MDAERATVWSVVGLVVVTTLLSGPLVGAVDLTTEPDRPALGSGSVSVASVSLPEQATLSAGRFGADEYTLRVPDATAEITAIDGRPILVYTLSIPVRGYTRSTTHFLAAHHTGTFTLSIADDGFEPSTVTRSEYDGRLQVVARANESERVVANRTITVAVVE